MKISNNDKQWMRNNGHLHYPETYRFSAFVNSLTRVYQYKRLDYLISGLSIMERGADIFLSAQETLKKLNHPEETLSL